MTPRPTLFSLDFTVSDLDGCLALLVELGGLELVGRARHPTFDAEVAQLRAGGVVFNLLHPTETGRGRPFPTPEPSLTNFTFVLQQEEDIGVLRGQLVAGGAAVFAPVEGQFALDAQMIRGLLGVEAPMIFGAPSSLVAFG